VAEVDDLFGVAEYKHGARPFVAGIRRRGRIAFPKPGHQGAITDSAGPSAVSDTEKFAVPSTGRHPDFDLDLGVGRRPDHRGDAAPCGGLQRRRLVALCGAGDHKGSGRDGLGRNDGGVGQGQRFQAFAVPCLRRGIRGNHDQKGDEFHGNDYE
jgi:hypothetical protein